MELLNVKTLDYGVLGVLFFVLGYVIPRLFGMARHLNEANRQAEGEQRLAFQSALDRISKHCEDEISRMIEAFGKAQAASDRRMATLVDALQQMSDGSHPRGGRVEHE